jgi:hypothetical protein
VVDFYNQTIILGCFFHYDKQHDSTGWGVTNLLHTLERSIIKKTQKITALKSNPLNQLTFLFMPTCTTTKKQTTTETIESLANAQLSDFLALLEEDEMITPRLRYHPEVVQFLETWVAYIKLPKENLQEYDRVKGLFCKLFSEADFYYYLEYTRYFHQIAWLKKKGLSYAERT